MQTLTHKFRAALQMSRNRMVAIALAVAATVGIGMLLGRSAHAQGLTTELGATTALLIGYTAFHIAGLFGTLLLKAVEILVWVATYNGFVTATPVVTGWVIVRDVANMFFILALLLIAFGTILGVDKYSYRNKQLSRLLLMAVVVNFSRTIAGLLIDFSQVVMLTFVNGFSQAAGGNFLTAFRINELYASSPDLASVAIGSGVSPDQASVAWGISISMLLALGMTVIALSTVIIMTVVLLWRIVMLWLLTIMSPLAFFLGGVPGGFASGYYEQWWKEFKSQVVVGPFLAFFLWLSLVSVSSGGNLLGAEPAGFGESIGPTFSAAFNSKSIGSFAIAIALMLGGVKMAQSMSSAVGMGKQVTGALSGWAKGAGKWGVNQIDKRTGFQAFRKQRAAASEARSNAVYAERGAVQFERLQKAKAAIKNAAGAPLAAMQDNASKAVNYRKMAQDERAAGNIEKADEYMAKARDLQASRGSIGDRLRRYTGLAAVGGGIGAGLKDDAKKDREFVSTREQARIDAAKKGVASMTGGDLKEALEGTLPIKDKNEERAMILAAAEKGLPALNGKMDIYQQRMKDAGATQGELEAFKAARNKNFVTEGQYNSDPVKNQREVDKAVDAGKIDINADMSDDTIKQLSLAIASSVNAAKYEEKMTANQRKTYNEELEKAVRGDVDAKNQREKAKRDPADGGPEKTGIQVDQALAGAMTRTLKDRAKGDRAKALASAYGIEGGKVTETMDVNGAIAKSPVANLENFRKELTGKNAAALALAIPEDQLIDASTGAITDLGKIVAEEFSKNTAQFSNVAAEAAKSGTPEAQRSMEALMEAVEQGGNDRARKAMKDGRSFQSFQGRPPAAEQRRAAAESAAKAAAEAKTEQESTASAQEELRKGNEKRRADRDAAKKKADDDAKKGGTDYGNRDL